MILDLHTHSEASEDSRAPVETYLKWLQRKRDLLRLHLCSKIGNMRRQQEDFLLHLH